MKHLFAAIAALLALPIFAQTAPAPAKPADDPGKRPVAIVNGQTITAADLDFLYDRLGTKAREAYNAQGGKSAYLENYIRKRLVVQEAIKHNFDQRPEVKADMQASAEATLFDRYVRDVISAPLITDAELKKYYDENPKDFEIPEKVKVRHIIIVPTDNGPNRKTRAEAQEKIQAIAAALHQQNIFPAGTDEDTVHRLVLHNFEEAAKKYSEDAAAPSGGDLGWVGKGVLDPTFEQAAFLLKKGVMSGIVETRFGFHLILVEDKKQASTMSFEEAKPQIREFLMTQHAVDVLETVNKLTNQLRANSNVATFPQNITAK
ncbi:MAG TPA: peptidylprolyl isomerase [Thermoanaerobaculia bacterium]|nr:peptidylprolyl isomerase [Thermoanaerobaculia bacterium]